MPKEYSTLQDPNGGSWHMVKQQRRSGSFEVRFVQLFPEYMMELAREPEVTGAAFRVYLWALDNLSHERWQMIEQDAIAKELKISKAAVSRGMKTLDEKEFLEKQGTRMRMRWRLTPKGSWCGTAAAYQKEMRGRRMTEEEKEQIAKNREATKAPAQSKVLKIGDFWKRDDA